MLKFNTDKKPAFFRSSSPEIFFEAETLDTDGLVSSLNSEVEIDNELNEILEILEKNELQK